MKPKSIGSRASSKNESIRSKLTDYKKKKLIEAIFKMDDDQIDALSR